MAGIAVQQGRTFLTDDYLADARFPHIDQSDELVERTGYVSVPAAPMRGEHGSLGSISVSSNRTGAYDEASAQLLQALADQAAITIQNARLIAELNRSRTQLRRRAEEEQSLREIAARISATKGARDVLQRIVDEAARLLAADESRIDLIERGVRAAALGLPLRGDDAVRLVEWPDNPDEKIEQGSPAWPSSKAACVDRRLPQRPGLHPRLVVGPLRQGDRHQLGDVGAAPRRRPGVRGAHDLHPPERGLGTDDARPHRGDREPGRDRDLDRPADRGARPVQR